MNHKKYQQGQVINFPKRTWPEKRQSKAPLWCSVDLRDGNQSLVTPLTLEQKLEFFVFLTKVGFKEIEVGFPFASESEFQFVRTLIERNLIPDDVTIQVLTQSREAVIRRTFESLRGVKRATVHLYNATSPLFRETVFGKSKEETIELAVYGANMFKEIAAEFSASGGKEEFAFEYSPECFSQTEPDFAIEVCNAVISCWEGFPTIINLPFTVESLTPNAHADLIEYVCGKLKNRDKITVSLHAHNDRGTAVAATELCLLAGADRVEGTLFGNGERTGNADIITLAMNLYSQGIDPELDFSNINDAIALYERTTCLAVHPRHPYAGELVFTAFSGSHQDAIRKGMAKRKDGDMWEIPYLPIDPGDVGRGYEPIIRVNSQSGSSSAAYILETNFGIHLPKSFQRDFGPVVTAFSDTHAAEISSEEIYKLFNKTYVNLETPYRFVSKQDFIQEFEACSLECTMQFGGEEKSIRGRGNGVIDAFCQALFEYGLSFDIAHYSQHSLDIGEGARARAITYIGIVLNGKTFFGAGVSRSTTNSALKAVVSAINKRSHDG
ncbi:MAG: 2-isopropylmalate synthase [Defluviitaleaceae bacterium]|nr:2-isopropylmalate synthase [Defluviitaleaceae bacterium]